MSQRRNIFSRFEGLLTGIFEGAIGKIFRTRLQPVELTRKLERAMDENLTVSPNRRTAPNAYQLFISQYDYTRFAAQMQGLLKTLQDGLIAVARQRGYFLSTRPVVKILVEPQLGTGEVRCEALLLDNAQLPAFAGQRPSGALNGAPPAGSPPMAGPPPTRTPSAQLGGAPDATQFIDQGAMPAPQGPAGAVIAPASLPYGALVMRTTQGPGQTFVLNRDVIHIGRHSKNDIVINDRRVSRYHAEIRFERGQFVLYDLGSLNGVLINGVLQRQVPLRNGDIVAFGNYSFVFERR